jgi:K+-sensing histidine kinase KdpD
MYPAIRCEWRRVVGNRPEDGKGSFKPAGRAARGVQVQRGRDAYEQQTARGHDSSVVGHHRRRDWDLRRNRVGTRWNRRHVHRCHRCGAGRRARGNGRRRRRSIRAHLRVWLFVLAAVEIVFGVGALGLKPWAWTIGVYWCYLSAVSNVLGIFSRGGLFSALIGIVIAVAILYYLFTTPVKSAFGKADSPTPGFLVPVFGMIDGQINKGSAQRPGAYTPPPASPTDPNRPEPPA